MSLHLATEKAVSVRRATITVLMVGVAVVLLAMAPKAQSPTQKAQGPTNSLEPTKTPPIDISAADIQAFIKMGVNNPMKSLDAGPHVVFVWYETRQPGKGDPVQHNLTEIYIIQEGSAMLRTGGKITGKYKTDVLPTLLPGTDVVRFPIYSIRGEAEGGYARKVKAGDVVVLPPNIVHTWEVVDGPTPLSYLNIRIDPLHRLSAGYVNPALKK